MKIEMPELRNIAQKSVIQKIVLFCVVFELTKITSEPEDFLKCYLKMIIVMAEIAN